MASPASVHFAQATITVEKQPKSIIDPADIALLNATAWFPGDASMMEGVTSALPFKWKSIIDVQSFTPDNIAVPPIKANDNVINKDYLQFGYGGSLARRTNTLKSVRLASGGSGHVVGDIVTFTNGVQLTVVSVSSGAISTFTLSNAGSFSSQPSAALSQTGTTGSGTGASIIPEFSTANGSLSLLPSPALIPSTAFSIIVVFRCPIVGGVAGSDPGGFVLGSQLNQSEIFNTTANNRWWGLRLGGPSGFGASSGGKLIFQLMGDTLFLTSPGSTDYRDGQWHIAMMTFAPGIGAGSATLWIDGAQIATVSTFANLNILADAKNLRVGAAGLGAAGVSGGFGIVSGPTGGYAGDLGDYFIEPLDLNASANAATRQGILNRLLSVWRGGGTSA